MIVYFLHQACLHRYRCKADEELELTKVEVCQESKQSHQWEGEYEGYGHIDLSWNLNLIRSHDNTLE